MKELSRAATLALDDEDDNLSFLGGAGAGEGDPDGDEGGVDLLRPGGGGHSMGMLVGPLILDPKKLFGRERASIASVGA